MKQKKFIFILLFILLIINNCSGYKPIFDSSSFKFYIEEHTIKGNKKLGNKIYTRLYNISNFNKNTDVQSISIIIQVDKNKFATVKDKNGKVLEYKINLNTSVIVTNFLNKEKVLNQDFNYASSYKVQEQYSQTLKLENKTTISSEYAQN